MFPSVIRPEKNFKIIYKIEKYSLSKSAYHIDMFPPYCGGPCSLLPTSYVKTAFPVARKTNPGDFHDEDVLFTGIIRVKSGAPEPEKVNGICTHYNNNDKVDKIRNGICYLLHL